HYAIGPYEYRAGKESVALPAIAMKALSPRAVDSEGQVQNANQQSALFARLSTDKHTLYNQEVFDLFIEIYYRGDINVGREINLLNMPPSGLSLQPFEEISPSREVVNNEIFEVRRFRCKANALTAGSFTLQPTLRIPLIVQRKRDQRGFFGDPFGDFFGGRQTQPVDVTTEPLTLDIQSLPEKGRPAGFSGAVGNFNMDVNIKPKDLEVGEPITVTILLSGSGNMDVLTPPAYQDNGLFKAYEMRRIESDTQGANGTGRRIFEQVVIPKSDTITSLPELKLSFFDPAKAQYETIRRGPFPLTVRKSSKSEAQLIQARAPGSESEAKLLGADLVYLKSAPPDWSRKTHRPLYLRPLFWPATLFPPCALAAAFLLMRRKTELQNNRAKARRLRAPKSARAGLRQAEQALKNNQPAAYHDGLWNALSSYFGDRLNLAPGEVSAHQVIEHCRQGGLPAEHLDLLRRLFEECDEFRFGAASYARTDISLMASDLKAVPNLLKATERIRL
ncbi:MAG: BatD family protein, partial [Kiritimatiellae bacterium]|nr:BatD family protein [Kiritimatiellia bacterium]